MLNFVKQLKLWIAICIIGIAIISSLVRAVTPFAIYYQPELENYLSKMLNHKVIIKSMQTGWYWFTPVIRLNGVRILDGKHTIIQIKKFMLGINIINSILDWQIKPNLLYIDTFHIRLCKINNQWQVGSFAGGAVDQAALTSVNNIGLNWLLLQKKIILKQISIDLEKQDGSILPIRDLNFTIIRNHGSYRFKAKAGMQNHGLASLQLLGNVAFKPNNMRNQLQSKIYLNLKNVKLAEWRDFFYGLVPITPMSGMLNGKFWFHLNHLSLIKAQADINLQQLAVKIPKLKDILHVDAIQGNLFWKSSATGWQFKSSTLDLQLNGTSWPTNELLITYDHTHPTWDIYIQHILLNTLPIYVKKIISVPIYGSLNDTHIHLQDQRITSLITQFTDLGWKKNAYYPALNKLNGVIDWQPDSGKLALDGRNPMLQLQNYPAISFTHINTALTWHTTNNGLDIDLQHLTLRHPNLLLKATGNLTNVGSSSGPVVSINTEFAATQAQYWLTYLPINYVQPKLVAWFQENIKQIDRIIAKLQLDGNLKQFPFDKNPGVFHLNAYIKGMILKIAKNWAPITQMEGYLHLDKRLLTADITHANLQNTLIKPTTLKMQALGSGHEILLLDLPAGLKLKLYFKPDALWRLHLDYPGWELYPKLVVDAIKIADNNWDVNVNQPDFVAHLHYKTNLNLITGLINKIHIRTQKNSVTKLSSMKISQIPNLNLNFKNLTYGSVNFGDGELQSTTNKSALVINSCKIHTNNYNILLTGQWTQHILNNKPDILHNQTSIKIDWLIHNLSKTLEEFNITPAVNSNDGAIQMEVRWNGAIQDFSLPILKGTIDMLFKDGRITHLSRETEEKLGLGKLLSIVSLQTIPRRLKLDFSDLTSEGYAFDKLQGHFSLMNGVLNTTNTFIDGPVAHASMAGALDIARQLYNIELKISPHITSSLPIVAAIAVGSPIAGIAVWAADKIINQGVQKINEYTYKVTGPWKNPLVEQLKIKRNRI